MHKLSLAVLAIGIAATLTVAGLASNDNDDAQALSQINGYQQWTKVNADPVKVEVPKTATDLIALGVAETPL